MAFLPNTNVKRHVMMPSHHFRNNNNNNNNNNIIGNDVDIMTDSTTFHVPPIHPLSSSSSSSLSSLASSGGQYQDDFPTAIYSNDHNIDDSDYDSDYVPPTKTLVNEKPSESPQQQQLMEPSRQIQRVVLVGGGHAHVQVIKALNEQARGRHVHITLIDMNPFATYSGMIPGCIINYYTVDDVKINIKELADWSSIDFIQDTVIQLDCMKQYVYMKHHPPQPYDILSIDIGSTTRHLLTIPGAYQYTIPTRPIHRLLERIQYHAMNDQIYYQTNHPQKKTKMVISSSHHHPMTITQQDPSHQMHHNDSMPSSISTTAASTIVRTEDMEEYIPNDHLSIPHLVVVGGGIAGIELALSMTCRWKESVHVDTYCTILQQESYLLSGDDTISESSRQRLIHILTEHDIHVLYHVNVEQVTEHDIYIQYATESQQQQSSSSTIIPYSHCIWATGASSHSTTKEWESFLDCDDHGWIIVKSTLQSMKYPNVLAAGDCCTVMNDDDDDSTTMSTMKKVPKAGVYAVRAGPILIENITKLLLQQQQQQRNQQREHDSGNTNHDQNTITSSITLSSTKPSYPITFTKYIPQNDFMKLIVCGKYKAFGFRYGISFYGKWVFHMKDHIDRNFMNLFDVKHLGPKPILEEGQQDIIPIQTHQYDANIIIQSSDLLHPIDAAKLIQRTDDHVDYMIAWQILRAMGQDPIYCNAVLHEIRQQQQ